MKRYQSRRVTFIRISVACQNVKSFVHPANVLPQGPFPSIANFDEIDANSKTKSVPLIVVIAPTSVRHREILLVALNDQNPISYQHLKIIAWSLRAGCSRVRDCNQSPAHGNTFVIVDRLE